MWIEIKDESAKIAVPFLLLAGHKEFVEIALAIEDAIAKARATQAVDQAAAIDPSKAPSYSATPSRRPADTGSVVDKSGEYVLAKAQHS
jgi:hypothetical protein